MGLTLFLLLALAADVPVANPIAPAASGMLQCYDPDLEKKVCQSLAGYQKRSDGGYDNTAIVLLSPTPVVTMETVTPVVIEGGAVCGAIRKSDIDLAVITVAGARLDEQRSIAARTRIATAMASLIGKRICTRYVAEGAQFRADVTIDGVAAPEMNQTVAWVSSTAGFTVAP